MQAKRSSAPISTDVIGCHRCGAEASVRVGKEYLCPACAVSDVGASSDDTPVVLCDLCDGESLVRLRERFLCARCALAALSLSPSDLGALSAQSADVLDAFAQGEHEPVLAHGLEVGKLAREGAMRLVDLAAVHHAALARSMTRARDALECVQRVQGGSVLFNVWAVSFDARLEELQRQNEVLVRLSEGLERQVDELDRHREELLRTLRRTEADRRWAVRRLIEAKEQERRRISLDLHDDAVQVLIGIRMRLEAIRRREADAERRSELEEVETTTQLCIGRLRGLMFELRSDLLEGHGLAGTLRQLLDRVTDQAGLTVALEDHLAHEPEAFARTNIYRIAQEAISNVRKHAKASRIEVTLDERDGGILVAVRDDGIGFSTESVSASGEHLGLEAMHERAKLSGGWVRVDSAPGAGATVAIWVPTRIPEAVQGVPGSGHAS